jgi:hypothetical protein
MGSSPNVDYIDVVFSYFNWFFSSQSGKILFELCELLRLSPGNGSEEMNRRTSIDIVDPTPERENQTTTLNRSDTGSDTPTGNGPQFLSIRSRIGKRYQASLPALISEKPVQREEIASRSRYCLEKANSK